jgi:hypothetical protein
MDLPQGTNISGHAIVRMVTAKHLIEVLHLLLITANTLPRKLPRMQSIAISKRGANFCPLPEASRTKDLGQERVPSEFSEANNCKDPLYR